MPGSCPFAIDLTTGRLAPYRPNTDRSIKYINPRRFIKALLLSRRILVLGPSGAGKTRLALRLGALLDLEVTHLDAHFWKPGWIATPQSEWRREVTVLAGRESWIMDGTYESTLDLRIPRADAVILIRDNRWNCLLRVFYRWITTSQRARPDAPPGQRLDGPFLRYIWNYTEETEPIIKEELEKHGSGTLTIALHGQREISDFLRELESQSTGRTLN